MDRFMQKVKLCRENAREFRLSWYSKGREGESYGERAVSTTRNHQDQEVIWSEQV